MWRLWTRHTSRFEMISAVHISSRGLYSFHLVVLSSYIIKIVVILKYHGSWSHHFWFGVVDRISEARYMFWSVCQYVVMWTTDFLGSGNIRDREIATKITYLYEVPLTTKMYNLYNQRLALRNNGDLFLSFLKVSLTS